MQTHLNYTFRVRNVNRDEYENLFLQDFQVAYINPDPTCGI